MFKVYPIAHLPGYFIPFILEAHHYLSAFEVVIFYGNFVANIFFCNTQFFLYAQFYRKAMSIPATFPFYLETLHGLISAYQVFKCAGYYVVNARHSVSTWWALIKYKSFVSFP